MISLGIELCVTRSIRVLDSQMAVVPPILHFSKKATGTLRFNGLCILDRLELTWFEDQGRPVRNYRAHLTILDEEFVDVTWLHSRVTATDPHRRAAIRMASSIACGSG